jgi:hypothetical protein
MTEVKRATWLSESVSKVEAVRTLGRRSAFSISLGIGGAILILVAWEVFTAGAAATNVIGTVNRGLVPADILWMISVVCFATAILVYGTNPDSSSDELSDN